MAQDFQALDADRALSLQVEDQNNNFEAVRSSFSGATPPDNPVVGQKWFSTGDFFERVWDGVAWRPIAGGNVRRASWAVIDIDGTATGQTVIVPAITSQRFLTLGILVELTEISGAGDPPTVRFGNTGSFDQVVAANQLVITSAHTFQVMALVSPSPALDIGTDGLAIDVSVASARDSYVMNAYVEGILRP